MDTMQFDDLMSMAQSNIRLGQKKIQSFVAPKFTVTAKPKKLTAKEKQLSEGVKKFLEKKQEEERRKAMEEKLKKEKLVQLRNQDSKATRRVAAMLKMTKSANKAVMGDAVDCLSDSLVGQDIQPDEDDFGFVSDSAQIWQKKLMEKYNKMPLSNKTEVKPPSAKPLPIKSKQSQSQSRSGPTKDNYENRPFTETVKKKPVKPAPPPVLNFQDMLKLAEKKSQEPVKPLEPKPLAKVPAEKESFEFGRPMTARQKKQFMIEKAAREKIESGSFSLAASPVPVSSKLPKISFKKKDPAKDGEKSPPNVPSSSKDASSHDLSTSHRKDTSSRKDISDCRKPESLITVRELPASCFKKPLPSSVTNGVLDRTKSKSSDSALHQKKPGSSSAVAEKSKLSASNTSINHKRDFDRSAPPHRPTVPRFEQKTLNPVVHPRSPPSRFQPRHEGHQGARPAKRPLVIDSDDEYDSEMDDFIDDSEDHMDISAMIRNITGYDRRKFAHIDEDDIQETSAHEQMEEERRSARIGKKEDLEDMRQEEEEKRRKALLKKKMKR